MEDQNTEEHFTLTPELRRAKKFFKGGHGWTISLEQLWIGDKGTRRWKKVPLVSSKELADYYEQSEDE